MMTMKQNIVLKNLDKTNWKSFRFDQIANKISETVDPNTTDLEIYIGLEHIDAESIHINRQGTPADVSGGKLKCYPGDVIFGKRRAYQRKAAIVDFEGICSAHAFVLRANPKVIDPKLFPFFLHSDLFMHKAVDISVGGLSPTINWGQLKEQEFLLPPKDQQAQLAELLWTMDEVIARENEVLEKLIKEDLAYLKHYFYDDKNSERIKLKHIVSVKKGKKPPVLLEEGDGLPYCTAKYLRTGKIESIVPKESWNKSIKIDETDILILWDGSNAGEMLFGKEGFLASTMCKLIIKKEGFLKDFVFQFLRFKTNDIKRATVGSAIPHVDPGMIENIEIPKLTKIDQEVIINLFNSLNNSIKLVELKISSSKSLQKSLINQVF
ncbi:restriction endonuclease subunit S [Aequorivita sp. SDUM287046]|uniref:Restriction endonuclease subunit S n=1 Tax=Aequorivita aurantiaca TaxID=3053356 RepID=A0ABT8DPE7_9FLAO|nr:restriction endonuclease subunit S [Aequorivita aurantiaca]MDN3725123.1 restriction endonuclease subunit S [Aequorivita aurantiaca]